MEFFTAVTMKNPVVWNVMSFGSWKKLYFGPMYSLHQQGEKNLRARNVSSKIVTEAVCEEMSATWRHIPENGFFKSKFSSFRYSKGPFRHISQSTALNAAVILCALHTHTHINKIFHFFAFPFPSKTKEENLSFQKKCSRDQIYLPAM
jgi:hypothetical protein